MLLLRQQRCAIRCCAINSRVQVLLFRLPAAPPAAYANVC
jgi:hypothetical protein